MPVTQPIRLIAAQPGVTASDAYIGLDADPVVAGRIRDSFLTNSLTGSVDGAYFTRDRMTVLAGRLPRLGAAREIAVSPGIARLFGVGVGGQVTYQFYRLNPVTYRPSPGQRLTFRVTGIADIPPVLVDQSDEQEGGVLPPAATRQLLPYYVFSWVGVRLGHGTAGIPALQHHLATLATTVQRRYLAATHQKLPGLTFAVARQDIVRSEVRQAIGPQVVALTVFGAIAALAMLVLAGQGAAAIVNATQMGGQPAGWPWPGRGAMTSLALTVLTSVRRRRRELALLKTLGMTRRQLRAIVAWQTTLTLLIALVVGVPLGVAAGRWAWRGFAGSLGVAPVTVVPVRPAGRRLRRGHPGRTCWPRSPRRSPPGRRRGHAAHGVAPGCCAGSARPPGTTADRKAPLVPGGWDPGAPWPLGMHPALAAR